MPYKRINEQAIHVYPLGQRRNFIDLTAPADRGGAIDPDSPPPNPGNAGPAINDLAQAFRNAKTHYAARIITYGAHTIKNGCGPLLRRLIERGWVTHLATQGAGIIHDWEIAHMGQTSESVRDNAPVGMFGTWDETGENILGAVLIGAGRGRGFGESIGHHMQHHSDRHPYRKLSVTHAAYHHHVPLCVMPGIGYDIFCCHPMFNPDTGAAIGFTATMDFQTFVQGISNLTNGVYMSVGSSVMSPQVFEKALSIANNLRKGEGLDYITNHTVGVVDIQPSGNWDWTSEKEPPADHPAYYLRWCKTFARLTAPHPVAKTQGKLQYIQSDNRVVLHNLVHQLCRA